MTKKGLGEASGFRIPKAISTELREHLEQRIVFGDIAAGSRLVEEDVVSEYDVSRSPVREALRMLEQDGLLVRESRRGLKVGNLTIEDLDEVYSCRLALEKMAAEQAAKKRTDADIAALRNAVCQLEEVQGDTKHFFKINLQLSDKIYESSHNHTLIRLLQSISKQAMRYRYFAYQTNPMLTSLSVNSNRAIIEAIELSNPDHASALTRDVIGKSWNSIRATLEKGSVPTECS